MRAWIVAVWDSLRESFWFLPSLLTAISIVAAFLALQIDARYDVSQSGSLGFMATTGPAARATLSSLSGALITVVSVVFSITMVTLSLTTSQFGSRLLRTFTRQSVTQLTLGVFLGAALFCLLILRSVELGGTNRFVPHVSVATALVFSIAALGVLIFFVQHIANSVQAQTVVQSVAAELDAAIDVLFPDRVTDEQTGGGGRTEVIAAARAETQMPGDGKTVRSEIQGYLQAIDRETLVRVAGRHAVVVRLNYRPGDFVTLGTPLAVVSPADRVQGSLVRELNRAFVTGNRRTPRQDVECALLELVEVAVRALSPGINDVFTAMTCIDYLGASLSRIADRRIPSPYQFDDSQNLRVVAKTVTFADAVGTAFDQIRQAGQNDTAVTIRLLEALIAVAHHVERPEDRDVLANHAEMILRSANRSLPEENDRRDVAERFDQLQALLSQPAKFSSDQSAR